MTLVIERSHDTHDGNAPAYRNEPVALLRQVDTRRSDLSVFVSRDNVVVREDYHVYIGTGSDLASVRIVAWHRDPNSGDLTIVTDAETIYIPRPSSRWSPYYGDAKMYRLDGVTITEKTGEWIRMDEN